MSILILDVFEFESVGGGRLWVESWGTAAGLECVETGLTELETSDGNVLNVLGDVRVSECNKICCTTSSSVEEASVLGISSVSVHVRARP